MYGNNNSLSTYKSFEARKLSEVTSEADKKSNSDTTSLVKKPVKDKGIEATEPTPTDVAYNAYRIINKERLNIGKA